MWWKHFLKKNSTGSSKGSDLSEEMPAPYFARPFSRRLRAYFVWGTMLGPGTTDCCKIHSRASLVQWKNKRTCSNGGRKTLN
jgi:hypothetical protein